MAAMGGGPESELGYWMSISIKMVTIGSFGLQVSDFHLLTKPKASSASLAMPSKTGRISSLFVKGVLKSMKASFVVPSGNWYSTVNPLALMLLKVADTALS